MVRDKRSGEPFAPELRVSERVASRALDNGLICRPLGQAIVLCPPFIMSDGEMDTMLERLETTMIEVFATL